VGPYGVIGENKMAKYVQTNEHGYVTGIVEEPLLANLFGGAQHFRNVGDEEAETIKTLLEAHHRMGEGLHINVLDHKE